jgi:hypothetical protein
MTLTFVLPSRIVSGGTRVLFEYCKEFTRRGYKANIVFPLVPLSINYEVNRTNKSIKNCLKMD